MRKLSTRIVLTSDVAARALRSVRHIYKYISRLLEVQNHTELQIKSLIDTNLNTNRVCHNVYLHFVAFLSAIYFRLYKLYLDW